MLCVEPRIVCAASALQHFRRSEAPEGLEGLSIAVVESYHSCVFGQKKKAGCFMARKSQGTTPVKRACADLPHLHGRLARDRLPSVPAAY